MWPIMGVSITDDTKKAPHPTGGVPYACIRRKQDTTICDRGIDENTEFVFRDAAYAISRYGNSPTLRVCPDCAKICEAEGIGATKMIAPMATRGMKDNNQ